MAFRPTHAGISLLALATAIGSPAAAQTAPAPAVVDQAQTVANGQPADVSATDQTVQDITVTGSRIARPGLASDSPIVTVGNEAFGQTGAVTLDQTLNKLPQLVAAGSQSTNDITNGGINTLSLRGLGTARTLVLLDGKRLTPSTADGSIDINNIPEALLSTVEIITGGASSTYGSDAVAGVVNFKLDHRFTGLRVDIQTGISDRGDAGTQKATAAFGARLGGDRGHVLLGATYAHRDGFAQADRDFSAISRASSTLPSGSLVQAVGSYPTQAAVDAVFGSYGVAPGTVPRTSNLGFNLDGSLFKFSNGVVNYRDSLAGYGVTGTSLLYSAAGPNTLLVPYEKESLFGYGEYEIVDGVTAYVQGDYLHETSNNFYAAPPLTLSVPIANPFISADLRTLLASRPTPNANFTIAKRFLEGGLRSANITSDNFQALGGLKGGLGLGNWTWDVYGSYGQTSINRDATGGVNNAAVRQLLSAADGGASLCAGGLNPFGDRPVSAACTAYFVRETVTRTRLTQTVAEADLQGSLFRFFGGDARAAIGASYRRNTYRFSPDVQLSSGAVTSFGDPALPTSGNVDVKELYGELYLPLLRDLPFARELSVTLGYRYSDYNTVGGVSTYKADGQWRIGGGVMLRGGYARAIRAPSIGELFSPQVLATPVIGLAGAAGQGDPCDVNGAFRKGASGAQVRSLCLAQGLPASIADTYSFPGTQLLTGVAGGNPNLKAETADTYTAGLVLAPKFASGPFSELSLSVDYFHIRVKGTIGTIDGPSIVQKCFNYDGSNPTYDVSNVYCRFISRSPSTGEISRLETITSNLGTLLTSGIDIAGNARFDLGGQAGRVSLNSTVTYLDKFEVQNFPGGATLNFAGSIGNGGAFVGSGTAAHPKWKALTNLTYSNGPFDLGLQWRYINRMADASTVGVANATTPGVPHVNYFDVNLHVAATDRIGFRAGVTNISDTQPPVYTSFVQANTDPGTYDVVGRAFYFGASVKF